MPPKTRRKQQGPYFHYSPPKVLSMNGLGSNTSKSTSKDDAFVVKPSNIRIWIHEKDIGKLTKVLWAGQGNRLVKEASRNPKVKKFLSFVPYVLNQIKDVHQAVIDDDLDTLQKKLQPPVPEELVTTKDSNGLTVIHKAAGLGHTMVLEYLINKWPEGLHEIDITGKTPLHWAASAKHNQRCYNLLTKAGCEEDALDYKLKTPGYYRQKPNDLERSFLSLTPDAPRIPNDYNVDWNALLIENVPKVEYIQKQKSEPVIENGFGGLLNPLTIAKSVDSISEPDLIKNDPVLEDVASKFLNEPPTAPIKDQEDENNNMEKSENGLVNGDDPPITNGEADNENDELLIDRDEDADGGQDEEDEEPDEEVQLENDEVVLEKDDDDDDNYSQDPYEESDPEPEVILLNDDVVTENNEGVTENGEAVTNNNDNVAENGEALTNNNDNVAENDEVVLLLDTDDDNDDDEEVQLVLDDDDDDQKDESLQIDDAQIDKMNSELSDRESPSPSLAIEGFVQGESDDNQVQSESAAFVNKEDDEIENAVKSGDLENLANIVLNGDGNRLVNMKSDKSDVQAFLDNIPVYMTKIRRVHESARNGDIRELQSALDRRKFATAKDEISPNGATPLHVAVLFGNSSIVRYLSARFPETMSTVDKDNRTPLHYAATIKDNGHFYNMLSHLGSATNVTDNAGKTPEFYLDHEKSMEFLSHSDLLKSFGAESMAEDMLNDQGAPTGHNFEFRIFKTEQGKYLANTLGEPLIKGLTEVAEKRPANPVAYLAKYLGNLDSSNLDAENTPRAKLPESATSHNALKRLRPSPTTSDHFNDDVVENDDENGEDVNSPESTPKAEDRDEHGQSMLHFACARGHAKSALLTLIEESGIDITYRDELYRTARDVSLQASQPANAIEIDQYVLGLAATGEVSHFEHLQLNGYDHILDVVDDENNDLIEYTKLREHEELTEFLSSLRSFEEKREELHHYVRVRDFDKVKSVVENTSGNRIIKAKNYYGRTALHIAVLKENEEIVEYFTHKCKEALKIGDNLERTPLHYAMGSNNVESISRILIRKGAKRTTKDLKGRQPSYYFMNKSDILRLQEEEDEQR